MQYAKNGPYLCYFVIPIVSCEEDEEADMEPERQNVLVHFENNSADPQQIRYILDGER